MAYIDGPRPDDSFGVGFVSIRPTVLELQPSETLTLKIWGQGHAGGQKSDIFYGS